VYNAHTKDDPNGPDERQSHDIDGLDCTRRQLAAAKQAHEELTTAYAGVQKERVEAYAAIARVEGECDALQADLAATKDELAAAQTALHDCEMTLDAAKRHILTERVKVLNVLKSLGRYFEHFPTCAVWKDQSNLCTCGLDEAKAALNADLAAPPQPQAKPKAKEKH